MYVCKRLFGPKGSFLLERRSRSGSSPNQRSMLLKDKLLWIHFTMKERTTLLNQYSLFCSIKNKGSCYSKVSFFEYTLQWRTEQLCFIDTASFAELKKDCLIKERVHAIQSKLIKKRTAYYSIKTFEIVATKLVFWCFFTYFETKHTIRYLPSENSLAPSIFTILFFNIATSCNGGRNEHLFA